MLTVPYSYYHTVYGGKLSEEEFNSLLTGVVVDVNYYTNNALLPLRVQDASTYLLNAYRRCCCVLVDQTSSYEANGGVVVASRSAGKVSESYLASSLPKSAEAATLSVIEKYLGQFNLCCRWV